jgi:hypothetical protein
MSVQGRDLLTGKPKQVEVSYREIAKALDKSIEGECCYKLLRISSRHLQYRYLSCRWWFYSWTKEFLKKQTYLFTLQRSVVRGTGMALKTFRNLKVS